MNANDNTNISLGDFVAAALSPALIMTLIGSLVFFLMAVLYVGDFQGRLQWILSAYVFGAVLVARISMRGDIGDRASLYALILGLLTWIALLMYVQFPAGTWAADIGWAIHVGFILLIWWCARRLTLDCTLDAGPMDVSGAGLLDAAGLDQNRANASSDASETLPGKSKKSKRSKREKRGLAAWWARYRQYREEKQQRPRTHGVWVVYFSLAALPLFGLGQALIPAEHLPRRQYAFWLLCLYVVSGLGLLLTTTFLSLRRYLRQKKLRMPAAISTTWLLFGALLIVALLAVGAVLPRPYPEFAPLDKMLGFQSPERDPSAWAIKGDESTEGEGTPGQSSANKQAKGQAGSHGADKPSAKNGQGDRPGQSGANGKEQGKQDPGAKTGSNKQPGNKTGANHPSTIKNAQGQSTDKSNPAQKSGDPAAADKENTNGKAGSADQSGSLQSHNSWFEWLRPFANILKWIILGVVVLVIVFLLLRALLSFLANFTNWAKGLLNWFGTWWQGLWARPAGGDAVMVAETAAVVTQRPFGWFRDPFVAGTAGQMSDMELIRYSFEALEAWARERSLTRASGETPLEFGHRVGSEFPALEEEAHTLASCYATAAYAPDLLPAGCAEELQQFWQMLRDVTERPLSAGTLSVS